MWTRKARRIFAAITLACAVACRSGSADETPQRVASSTSSVAAAAEGSASATGAADPAAGTASTPSDSDLPSLLPRFASGDAPTYPRMSRRLGEEGWVEIAIDLRQDGEVVALAISDSSGSARLDAAALSAARTWRFWPRTGERGVDRLVHRVTFRLTRD